MTIQEVEERTGLTRSNIRYYEKEGLFSPKRDKENGYRNYSEGDVETIRRIAFLRTLGISVEEIRKIITGKLSLCQTVERQSRKLQDDLKAVQDAALACERLLKDAPASFSELDVEQYTADAKDYWDSSRSVFRYDFAGLLRVLSSRRTWKILFFLSLAISLVSYPGLPSEIPIQWNHGEAVSMGVKAGIFAYPVVMIVWRMILIPWLYLTLNRVLDGELLSEYTVNGICFIGLTVQIFTVLWSHGLTAIGVFPLIAADVILLLALAVLGIWELDHMPER